MGVIEPFKGYTPRGSDYEEYMRSPLWKWKSSLRRNMDGHRCRICRRSESQEETFDVHHITYERFKHERLDDLITLCMKCHESIHEHNRQFWHDVNVQKAESAKRRKAKALFDESFNPARKAWMDKFIDFCMPLEIMHGGYLQLTKREVVRDIIDAYSKDNPPPPDFYGHTSYIHVDDVANVFRNLKIIRVLAMKRLGYSQIEIIRKGGVNERIVRKWYQDENYSAARNLINDIEQKIEKESALWQR